MSPSPGIIIGCDSFLSLRNVVYGDLGARMPGLSVLVDPNQFESVKSVGGGSFDISTLIDFNPHSDPKFGQFLTRIQLSRKAYYDSSASYLRTISHASEGSIFDPRRLARQAVHTMRWLRAYGDGRRGLPLRGRREASLYLRDHPSALEYAILFERHETGLVVGFSPEGYREMLLLEAANRAGLKTAVMVRSRDNIGAKILHLPFADRYLVWSATIKKELVKQYPDIDPDRVTVTGTPQFDHHLDQKFRVSRDDFFRSIHLDPGRPLIVYTTTTPGLCQHEIDICQHLADAAHSGKFINGAQLLVRGHPRMFGSDIRLLHREYPEAVTYPRPGGFKYMSPEHEAVVLGEILADEPMHLSMLAYQDVQVNICGTMTIDSSILDKPTVNVFYDLPKGVDWSRSAKRFYSRTDVRWMMSYGASRLARTPKECVELINTYLQQPTLDSEGRKKAREDDCGPLDGKSGQRVAEALLKTLTGGVN